MMAKKETINVRDHSQEREWLLSLGKGNIFAGVQSLLQKVQESKAEKKAETKNKKGR
jgi:hypothetical protein